jgi:hypothetical protein
MHQGVNSVSTIMNKRTFIIITKQAVKPLGRPSNLLGRQPLGKAVVAGLLGLGKLGLCTLAPTGWLLAGVLAGGANNNQVCNQLAGSLLGQRGLLGLAGAHRCRCRHRCRHQHQHQCRHRHN